MFRMKTEEAVWSRLAIVAALAVSSAVHASGKLGPEVSPDCKSDSLRERFRSIAHERLRETIAETRAIGLAVECFGIGRTAYPGPTPGPVKLEWLARDIPELVDLPQNDVWGQPFLYWSDGAHYVIISYSSDGVPDHDYGAVLARPWVEAKPAVCGGASSKAGADLVFADGQHCQWPTGGGE